MRVDKSFYIPDSAKGPFSYAGGFVFAGEFGHERKSVSHQPAIQQELSRPPSMNSRVSWTGSRVSRVIQQEKIANRVSWGGISREDVQIGLGEDRSEIPYPAFAHSGEYGNSASDIEGVEKEMGWDPKSGKWAVRPISRDD